MCMCVCVCEEVGGEKKESRRERERNIQEGGIEEECVSMERTDRDGGRGVWGGIFF